MATIKAQILNLLGENTDYASGIADIDAIITEAVFKAATILPKKLLIQGNASGYNPEDLPDNNPESGVDPDIIPELILDGSMLIGDGSTIASDDIVLLIQRTLSNNIFVNNLPETEAYQTRFAQEIGIESKHQSLDPASIYFATDYSPVFWLEPTAVTDTRAIYTSPSTVPGTLISTGDPEVEENWLDLGNSALRMWKYSKQDIDGDTDTVLTGIPEPAITFVLKICAVEILNVSLASQITDDEDPELFGAITQLKGVLEKDLQAELGTFRELWK